MIVGKRVQLRAIEVEDLPLLVKWRNDPEIYQYFYEQEPLSLVMQSAWFEKLLQRSDERLWIIEARETDDQKPGHPSHGVAIGTVGLVHIDWRNRKAEWGRFLIYPDEYRHGGYGSEVESLILRYCFDHMNINRLQCEVFSENEAVIALHKKFGFQQEGLFREYVFKDGRYRSVAYLALLRQEYLSDAVQARVARYLD
jgi:UDP-4-amino-4,6-dideoxy-N-acetyl-beta-L-altrosamine N-acetyltransferase